MSSVKLWEGTVEEFPMRISGQEEIRSVNRLVTPILALKCHLEVMYNGEKKIEPCPICLSRDITSVTSYGRLGLIQGQGVHPIACYDILVMCNGSKEHEHSGVFTLLLCVS